MFLEHLIRKLRFASKWGAVRREEEEEGPGPDGPDEAETENGFEEKVKSLKTLLGNSSDVRIQHIRFGPGDGFSGAVVFVDGLISKLILTEAVLRPLKDWKGEEGETTGEDLLDILRQKVLCATDTRDFASLADLASGCLAGDTALLVEDCAGGLVINTKGWEQRNVAEPQSETVVRGPREGFTENMRTNTSLIRRKIRTGQLHVEQMTVGRKTRTSLCLMYLDGVADPKIVETVKYRIGRLDVEAILESGYIEEYIEDAPFSPFATISYSEKPDVVAAKILEGRVAIVVDGTPFVLTAPMLFVESFQTAEDYYTRPLYASLTRLLRFVGYTITVFGPAVYIALTVFHQELIPTTLLFSIAKAREGTPFPAFFEALIMVFAFELLREAGVRLPRPVGQAISIVGALIMGDAAVNAGIVGAPTVIAIAVTAVAGFLVPAQNDSASILRIVMMVLAAFVGFYGVCFGLLAMLIHLASLESFGVPYFDSLAHAQDAKDTLIRVPLWAMTKRPKDLAKGDTTRGRFFIPPLRPYASNEDDSI